MGSRTLVERARHVRIRRGMSIREAAIEAGVSFSVWAKWERGDGAPAGDSQERLRRWVDGEKPLPKREVARVKSLSERLDEHEARIEMLERRGTFVQG